MDKRWGVARSLENKKKIFYVSPKLRRIVT